MSSWGNMMKHVHLCRRCLHRNSNKGRCSLSLRSAGAALRVGFGVAQTAVWQTGVGPRGLRAVGLTSRPKRRPGASHRGLTCALQQVDACHAASASTLSACPAAAARDCRLECGVVVLGRHPGSVGAAAPLNLGFDHAARCDGG